MNRAARWGWTVAAIATTAAALVLGFVLAFSTADSERYERSFALLFWINVAVAALLLLVIVLVTVRMGLRLRRGRFGSRLLIKLAGIFALVGVLPGIVIYTVSWQFASRSIETWFDVRVAQALDAGLALGRETLQSLEADLQAKALGAAARLSEPGTRADEAALQRLREELGAREVALLSDSGQLLRWASSSPAATGVDRPAAEMLRKAQAGLPAVAVDGLEEGAVEGRITAMAPLAVNNASAAVASGARFLLVSLALPRTLAANAVAVQSAYSEYQQRALAREALRRMYIGTLTLTLVLAVFGALLLAIVLGNQITRPLLLLAEGVREVARGNLSARPVFASHDELGGLTRSFADMTQQVAEARSQVQRGVDQLESARARLQTILDNLTAGVIVFDPQRNIDSVNPGAARILGLPLQTHAGQRLDAIAELADFAHQVDERFEAMTRALEPGDREHWQDAFELAGATRTPVTVLARGALMPAGARLLVFDDISEVVSAQRAKAWAEVARRLAHEIKNPLTPIQLSAERLQHKLAARLESGDRAMLERGVATIVDQVESLKQLVNEFRDYARLPLAQPAALQLNDLVRDVAALYGQAQDSARLVLRLAPQLPAILGDATQLRQVVHNLLQNALDAVEPLASGHVQIATEPLRSGDGQIGGVRLSVQDNGPGFAEEVLRRAFEPYVTTKPRGTGLGLALVRKIADEHRARVRLRNLHADDSQDGPITGARVSISFFSLASPLSLARPVPSPPSTPSGLRP